MAFTFFFRDRQTLQRAVLETLQHTSGRERINVWDAGCAMGPEPYTLAILFAESMGFFSFKRLHIDASDLDAESEDFGEIIRAAVYPMEQLKRIPEETFKTHFRKNGRPGYFILEQKIRDRVHFRQHDLLTCKPFATGYSLVVCKNVLLHFPAAKRIEVLKMYHDVLLPGGILALEQTQEMPKELQGCFEQVSAQDKLFRKR